MKKVNIIVWVICVLSFASCNLFQEITFTGIEKIDIAGINQNGVEAVIKAKIKNPNFMSFVIRKSDMNVTINGLDVGTATLAENVKIKGNSEDVYTFKVKSDFSKISMTELPKLMAIAFSKNVTVGIKGDLKVGKGLIQKKIPVEIAEKVKL
jgi:LEA14-like dessication related protein